MMVNRQSNDLVVVVPRTPNYIIHVLSKRLVIHGSFNGARSPLSAGQPPAE